jgi:hypothetical protein
LAAQLQALCGVSRQRLLVYIKRAWTRCEKTLGVCSVPIQTLSSQKAKPFMFRPDPAQLFPDLSTLVLELIVRRAKCAPHGGVLTVMTLREKLIKLMRMRML